MLRWDNVEDQTLFGMTVKMYRDPYVTNDVFLTPLIGLELDHYAYEYYKSETFMYKILDVNFVNFIEERGDTERITEIHVSTREKDNATVY